MVRTARIALSFKGLHMANQISRKDFRFVSASDALVCDRFQAAFFSPRIATFLASDPLIDEFSLEHANSRTFGILRDLVCGDSVTLDEENAGIFVGLIEELGNVELSEIVMKFVSECDESNLSNCISRLKLKHRLEIGIASECDIIASHISELRRDEIRGIEAVLLSDILRSESIRIPSEDWLLDLILELGGLHSSLLGDILPAFCLIQLMIAFGINFGIDAAIELFMIQLTFYGIDALDLRNDRLTLLGLD
jgi:hypothetical protein